MKFVVDECTGTKVSLWLKSLGFDIFSVSLDGIGMKDSEIIEKAKNENRVILTNDKDFGELIFKNNIPHKGVIFLRLDDETSTNKILVLDNFFKNHFHLINNESFIVVTETSIRLAKSNKAP